MNETLDRREFAMGGAAFVAGLLLNGTGKARAEERSRRSVPSNSERQLFALRAP